MPLRWNFNKNAPSRQLSIQSSSKPKKTTSRAQSYSVLAVPHDSTGDPLAVTHLRPYSPSNRSQSLTLSVYSHSHVSLLLFVLWFSNQLNFIVSYLFIYSVWQTLELENGIHIFLLLLCWLIILKRILYIDTVSSSANLNLCLA